MVIWCRPEAISGPLHCLLLCLDCPSLRSLDQPALTASQAPPLPQRAPHSVLTLLSVPYSSLTACIWCLCFLLENKLHRARALLFLFTALSPSPRNSLCGYRMPGTTCWVWEPPSRWRGLDSIPSTAKQMKQNETMNPTNKERMKEQMQAGPKHKITENRGKPKARCSSPSSSQSPTLHAWPSRGVGLPSFHDLVLEGFFKSVSTCM